MAAEIALDRGWLVRIDQGSGCRVQVRRGLVWLTQHRCKEDWLLGPGEWFSLNRDGVALISALRPALFAIVRPARTTHPGAVHLVDGAGASETVMSWPASHAAPPARGPSRLRLGGDL